MKIQKNEVVFDDSKINLIKVCGVYVLLKDLVFSLNDGNWMIQRCEDKESAIEQFEYVCKMLRYNPNFIKIDGQNILVNISQVNSLEHVYDEDFKQYGVQLNYSNQKIVLSDTEKDVAEKWFMDLKDKTTQFSVNDEQFGEIISDEREYGE